jgi:predicted phage-related endonuclease
MKQRLPDTVGASEIAALFGCSPWLSEYALFAKHTGLWVDEEQRSAQEEERLSIGRELERPILDIWARRTGKVVTHNTESQRNPLYPGLSATPDAYEWTIEAPGEPADTIATIDVKTIQPWERREWAATGTPLHYRIQCQQQMMIEGVKRAWLVGLFGVNEIAAEELAHDPIMEEQIIERAAKFWRQVKGELPPPDVDGHRATMSALMAQKRSAGTVELGQGAWELRDAWQAAKKAAREAEKAAKSAQAKLLAALGPFDRGVFTDGSGVCMQKVERKAYQAKASSYYKLSAFKSENTEEGSEDDE